MNSQNHPTVRGRLLLLLRQKSKSVMSNYQLSFGKATNGYLLTPTTGMKGGGKRGLEWEERREERWGVVRDIPSDSKPATWVFPCFNKAVFRHFKEMTPLVPCNEPFDPALLKKTAPAGEEGARLRQLPLPLTHRRVRWLPARHSSAATTSLLSPSANSFKQNKRSQFMRSGCSMERILLS